MKEGEEKRKVGKRSPESEHLFPIILNIPNRSSKMNVFSLCNVHYLEIFNLVLFNARLKYSTQSNDEHLLYTQTCGNYYEGFEKMNPRQNINIYSTHIL